MENNSKYLLISKKNNIDPKVFSLLNDKSAISCKAIYETENLVNNKNTYKKNTYKKNITSTKEWVNSVYTYNKNYSKNLPVARNVINNLLTGYFNLSSLIKGKKSNSNALIEKKNTLNKTFVSKAEVKITSDKVNIMVYIYNRNKKTLLRGLRDNKTSLLLGKQIERKDTIKEAISILSSIRKIKDKIIKELDNDLALSNINSNLKSVNSNSIINNTLTQSFSNLESKYYSDYLNYKFYEKILSLYYRREVIVNNNKFKNWFLLGLKKTISNLYNKKVELNIVNQKYFYLNSDILMKTLATTVRNRNNRILAEIKKVLAVIPLPVFNRYSSQIKLKNTDNLQLINKGLKSNIFNSIKFKHIKGIWIKGAGRLSQRLTAARSLSKVRSIGNLTNVYETQLKKKFSRIRGNVKPNVQYTNLNSKTRNGAFGLKGWVNGN